MKRIRDLWVFRDTTLFVSDSFSKRVCHLDTIQPEAKRDMPRKKQGSIVTIACPVEINVLAERWSKNGSRCKKCGTQFVSFMSFVTQLFHVRQVFQRAKHSDCTRPNVKPNMTRTKVQGVTPHDHPDTRCGEPRCRLKNGLGCKKMCQPVFRFQVFRQTTLFRVRSGLLCRPIRRWSFARSPLAPFSKKPANS